MTKNWSCVVLWDSWFKSANGNQNYTTRVPLLIGLPQAATTKSKRLKHLGKAHTILRFIQQHVQTKSCKIAAPLKIPSSHCLIPLREGVTRRLSHSAFSHVLLFDQRQGLGQLNGDRSSTRSIFNMHSSYLTLSCLTWTLRFTRELQTELGKGKKAGMLPH